MAPPSLHSTINSCSTYDLGSSQLSLGTPWYQVTCRLITVTSPTNQWAAVPSARCYPHINLLLVINTEPKVCVQQKNASNSRHEDFAIVLHVSTLLELVQVFNWSVKGKQTMFLLLVLREVTVSLCVCARTLP